MSQEWFAGNFWELEIMQAGTMNSFGVVVVEKITAFISISKSVLLEILENDWNFLGSTG